LADVIAKDIEAEKATAEKASKRKSKHDDVHVLAKLTGQESPFSATPNTSLTS